MAADSGASNGCSPLNQAATSLQNELFANNLLLDNYRNDAMPSVKEDILKYIGELPEDSTLDDIEYYLYIRQKIEHGKEAARRGEVITQEAFEQRMNTWSGQSTGHSRP
jgi:hypothetical protein